MPNYEYDFTRLLRYVWNEVLNGFSTLQLHKVEKKIVHFVGNELHMQQLFHAKAKVFAFN